MEVIFFIVFPVVVLVVIVMVVIFFFCLFIIVFVKCLCLSVIFAINVWSGLFTSCFKLISGLFLSLSKMNRFLLLTGIGPTVSRDDALTWIQVVFATHLDYHKDHHYHWQYDIHQQIYQMFSNAIWFPTLFGRWQSYFVTRSMIGIPDSCLHSWSEICWKSKLDVSGESSCD